MKFYRPLFMSLAACSLLLLATAWISQPQGGKYRFFFQSDWAEEARYPYQYNKFDFFKLDKSQQEERIHSLLNLEKVDLKQGQALASEAVSKKLVHQLFDATLLADTYKGYYNSPDNKGAIKARYYNEIYSAPYPLDYEGQMVFTEMLYHIDRRPAKIKQMYREWSPLVYQLISKERYENEGLKLYVETLLRTAAHLRSQDYEELFVKLKYAESESSNDYCQPMFCPNLWEGYLEPKVEADFLHNCKERDPDFNTYCNYRDVMWFHTFWYRRYLEGNWKVVEGILEEVQAHYAE